MWIDKGTINEEKKSPTPQVPNNTVEKYLKQNLLKYKKLEKYKHRENFEYISFTTEHEYQIKTKFISLKYKLHFVMSVEIV